MGALGNIAVWLRGRGGIVLLVMASWVLLVVVGAGPEPVDSNTFTLPFLPRLLLAGIGILALIGLVLLPFLFRAQDGPLPERKSSSFQILVLGLIIAFIFFLVGPGSLLDEPETSVSAPLVEPTAENPAGVVALDPDYRKSIPVLLVACCIAGATLLWTRKRLAPALQAGDEADLEALDAQLLAALDEATDHLRFGEDPRLAVLAAYASLEAALATRGRGRSRSETPTEHLARVLVGHSAIVEPAIQLGGLYELARFSSQPITIEHQRDAAAALDKSRSKLSALLSGTS